MNTGTYQEVLPCGGTMRVSRSGWEIGYYFRGPDLRYNGTFVTIPGTSVQDYICAFEENFREFEALKAVIPAEGDFSTLGKQGMSIRIGRFAEGVCIQSYHMPISNSAHLKTVTNGYRYAEQRAPQVLAFLESLL